MELQLANHLSVTLESGKVQYSLLFHCSLISRWVCTESKMDSQPPSPNRRHRLSPKRQRNMDKLRKAVLGAMALDSTTPLFEETKNFIEMRLLQLFPIIRTPDHPPYAAVPFLFFFFLFLSCDLLNENNNSPIK